MDSQISGITERSKRTGPDVRESVARLLTWYAKHKRDLPWRRSSDPYHIWISEIMLQQTRVSAVLPYYARFLATIPGCAGAR